MAFKTKREKTAFKAGMVAQRRRCEKTLMPNSNLKSTEKPKQKSFTKSFTDDFEYTESGRIKGHYTVDGFFEPD